MSQRKNSKANDEDQIRKSHKFRKVGYRVNQNRNRQKSTKSESSKGNVKKQSNGSKQMVGETIDKGTAIKMI